MNARPLRRSSQTTDEQTAPLTFRETLPPALAERAWHAIKTVTLAQWPCGQGWTQFEVKRCYQTREEIYNVSITTTVENAS